MKISSRDEFNRANVFGLGQENTAFAQYFIGNSYLNPLTNPKETAVFLANVTFEPGCRNNWHIHHAKSGGGQLLICTAGSGKQTKDTETGVSPETETAAGQNAQDQETDDTETGTRERAADLEEGDEDAASGWEGV